jgi:hypothetical protein
MLARFAARGADQSICMRMVKLKHGWLQGLAAIAEQYAQRREANTLSKHVEREYNLVAQFGSLLADQAAKWAGLMENIQVDTGYRIAQKQAPASTALPV